MALPTVVDLQQYREQRISSEARQAIHAELERWLERLEEVMDEQGAHPRLWEITETIREQRQEFMAQGAKAWVQKHYAQELQQERAACPQCGRRRRRGGSGTPPGRDLDWHVHAGTPLLLLSGLSGGVLPVGCRVGAGGTRQTI